MRLAAGFHRNQTGQQRIKKVQSPMPLEQFAKHDRIRLIRPGNSASGLAQINARLPALLRERSMRWLYCSWDRVRFAAFP